MNAPPPRVSLPSVLLVIGIGLSCSLACSSSSAPPAITTAAVNAGVANGPGQAALAQLEAKLLARRGTTVLPPITADPDSIQQALRLAMPSVPSGSPSDRMNLSVLKLPNLGPGAKAETVYQIDAIGDFTSDYALAYASFANRVRVQLPGTTVFKLYVEQRSLWGVKLIALFQLE